MTGFILTGTIGRGEAFLIVGGLDLLFTRTRVAFDLLVRAVEILLDQIDLKFASHRFNLEEIIDILQLLIS